MVHHLPKGRDRRRATSKPDGRRHDSWVCMRHAARHQLGDGYATTGGKSEESFLVEPGAIGLAPLEEAAHGINQDAQGRLAQWAAGLAE
jgi:hypothetical protein